MNPQEFYEKMVELQKIDDLEDRHVAMDTTMCDLLESLGYEKGIRVFEDTDRWYA